MIQLNTDADNTQIEEENKMKLESYKKIYHSIVTNKIETRTGNLRDIFVANIDMTASDYDLRQPSYDPYGDFKNDDINEDSSNNYNSKADSNINHIVGGNDGSSVGGGNNIDDLIEYSRSSTSYFWDNEYMALNVKQVKKLEYNNWQ